MLNIGLQTNKRRKNFHNENHLKDFMLTTGVVRQLLKRHDTLPCVLVHLKQCTRTFKTMHSFIKIYIP